MQARSRALLGEDAGAVAVEAGTGTRIGAALAGYQVEELLGRGGMGVVYRAFDPRLKRRVALKLVAPELSGNERFRERFLRETELAASLDHPNVILVYEAGEHDGQLFLAMRHVNGTDLKRLLADGPLEPARVVAFCAQVAEALDAAHERGLVHRDVKPSNVLLDAHEHAYLADFGLTCSFHAGRLAGEGPSLGTPAYASPEQILGEDVDGRADVYALGCVLYECLTGRTPFARGSELATLFAHLHEQPLEASRSNPQLPQAIDPVIARSLAVDPAGRHSSCRELIDAARDALGLHDRILVRDRRPLLLGALALLAAATVVIAAAIALRGTDAPKPGLAVTENTLVRIDPRSSVITAVTKVGQGPESVAAGGRTVWVYNWDDRTVSGIDTETNAVRRTRSISGSPPHITGSSSIAADEDGAWVLSNAGGQGLLTRVQSGNELPRELAFPHDPVSIAVVEGVAWVGAKDIHGNVVLRVDARAGSVDKVIPLRHAAIDPQNPHRFIRWVAVGGGSVWALVGGTVFRIDPATSRVTGKVDLPGDEAVRIGAGFGAVWALTFVASSGKQLVRIDPRTLEITRTIDAPDLPGAGSSFTGSFAFGSDAIWWNGADTGTVWRVDPRSGAITSTIRLTPPVRGYFSAQPYAIAATSNAVWVTVRVPP